MPQYNWDYMLNDRQFTLVTEDQGNGSYRVVSVSGTIGGSQITGLGTANNPNNTVYTDAFSAANDGFQDRGVTFTLDNATTPQYNLSVISVITQQPGGGFTVRPQLFETFYDAGGAQAGQTSVDYTYTTNAPMPCFLAGTSIAVPGGHRRVEELAVGDGVLTADGRTATVRWVGRSRIIIGRRLDADTVLPVQIARDAVAPGVPVRDLLVSPGHGIRIDGHVFNAIDLVNGRTITQVERAVVDYHHVELDGPDWLMAEGLDAESYVDVGNRGLLSSPAAAAIGAGLGEEPSDLSPRTPRDEAGFAAVRRQLDERAALLGWSLNVPAAPWLLVGDERVAPIASVGARHWFRLPANVGEVAIGSASLRPSDTDAASSDRRRLGLSLAEIRIDGQMIALDDDRLGDGFYPAEAADGAEWRWTNGSARLSFDGRIHMVELLVAHAMPAAVHTPRPHAAVA